MNPEDVRFLFDFDRWATRLILEAVERDGGVDEATWSSTNMIDERGLGGILVHHLGASQRWRLGMSGSETLPSPEREPLPTTAGLRAAWDAEWRAVDPWLAAIDQAWLDQLEDGVTYGVALATSSTTGPSTAPRRRRSSPPSAGRRATSTCSTSRKRWRRSA